MESISKFWSTLTVANPACRDEIAAQEYSHDYHPITAQPDCPLYLAHVEFFHVLGVRPEVSQHHSRAVAECVGVVGDDGVNETLGVHLRAEGLPLAVGLGGNSIPLKT